MAAATIRRIAAFLFGGKSMNVDMIIAILSGGTIVAIVEGIREYLTWKRNRKAAAEDKENLDTDKRLEKMERQVEALVEGQKYILYDRIRFLGQSYIADGEIDFDDRRVLNDMHKSYHSGLGGNGDLDILMKEVNNLPLKKTK